jgi:hypothetical protein
MRGGSGDDARLTAADKRCREGVSPNKSLLSRTCWRHVEQAF